MDYRIPVSKSRLLRDVSVSPACVSFLLLLVARINKINGVSNFIWDKNALLTNRFTTHNQL